MQLPIFPHIAGLRGKSLLDIHTYSYDKSALWQKPTGKPVLCGKNLPENQSIELQWKNPTENRRTNSAWESDPNIAISFGNRNFLPIGYMCTLLLLLHKIHYKHQIKATVSINH